MYDADIEHFCAPVVHPTTGETITQYRKLANDPATRDVWSTAFGKEFGRMSQGDNKRDRRENNAFSLCHTVRLPKSQQIEW